MANPNKTVAKAIKHRPFDAEKQKEKEKRWEQNRDPFWAWVCEQAIKGVIFNTEQDAREAFTQQNT